MTLFTPPNIAIFGATGQVGRHIVRLITETKIATITHLVGSPQSIGQNYQDVWEAKENELATHYGPWYHATPYPDKFESQRIVGVNEIPDHAIVLSSVPDRVGQEEDALVRRGCTVFSNSPHRRLDPELPLIVPIENSFKKNNYLKIPNCTTIGLTLGLSPIMDIISSFRLSISTYQSISGQGDAKYPQSLAISNVFPLRNSSENTETLITQELARLLPKLTLSISCYRVPTEVGHLIDVAIPHDGTLPIDALKSRWNAVIESGYKAIVLVDDIGYPQSYASARIHSGMRVVIGNWKDDTGSKTIRFTMVINNLIRGAAGSLLLALQNHIGNTR